MKKIFYLMFISLMAVSFSACGSDDDDDGGGGASKPINVNIDVFYYSSEQDKNIIDVGSTVYMFDGFSTYNGGNWEYEGNGVFYSSKWGSRWEATQKKEVTQSGTTFSNIKGSDGHQYFTVVVESNSDKSKENRYYAIAPFNIEGKDVNLTYIYGGTITKK